MTEATVDHSDFGPWCAACERAGGMGTLYVHKIERGPKIGTRITYKHVGYAACGQSKVVELLAEQEPTQ